jgi:hypothetical protein
MQRLNKYFRHGGRYILDAGSVPFPTMRFWDTVRGFAGKYASTFQSQRCTLRNRSLGIRGFTSSNCGCHATASQ